MATLKYVYFSESDPSRWFEKQEDADRFDKINEVVDYITSAPDEGQGTTFEELIGRIMDRYEFKQRWDWKASEDVQE